MKTSPKVAFPQQYDQIYCPGPQAAHWVGYLLGLLLVMTGTDSIRSPARLPGPLYAVLFGTSMLVLGGAALVGTYLVRRRTAIALTAEGLYHRDWRNRVWHVAWGDLQQVTIAEAFRRGTDRMTGGPSYLGVQYEWLYLTGRSAPGGRTTAKARIRRRVLAEESDVEVNPMVSAIVTRAGLVPGPVRGHERSWVRGQGPGAGGQ